MNIAICTSTRSFPLKPLAAAVLLMYAAGIQSAPVFQNSPGGNVTVTTPDANTTEVTQTGSRAVANWREFSISEGETVRFIQDSAMSVILNRVTGEDISRIFGTLQANGRVFLINPNGIVFGANSQVSVNGLVASTLRLKPGFQGNNSNIEELELDASAASIVNNGQITANDILLIAPSIENNGTLTANGVNGAVQLIAASEVTVNTAGDNLAFEVQAGHEDALISQLGTVLAQGGRVVLLATPSGGASSVINVGGVNQAERISIDGDTIRLSGNINSGNATGALEVTGRNVSQTNAVDVGGEVRIGAASVSLGNAENDFTGTVNLNVSGTTTLADSNELTVQGEVGSATLNAGSVALGDLNAAGTLTVNAENSIELNDLTANRLVITADNVSQNADQTIAVTGTTSVNARSVTLDNAGNSFTGQLTLDVSEQATLNSVDTLTVQGEVGSTRLTANSVVLGNLTASDDFTATAQQVSQVENGALNVAGITTLNAEVVDLGNAGNSFAQPVNLNVADQTNLRGTGRLEVAGNVNNATLEAQNLVLSNLAAGGDLTLKADTINQTTNLLVQGTTRIENTGEVNLTLSNDFVEGVTLAGSNSSNATVHLTDRNDIDVGGQAGVVTITATEPGSGVVTLRNLRAQALSVNANTVRNADTSTFSGSVNVTGTTQLTADNVALNNVRNNFGGQVELQVGGQALLTADNNLSVHGNAADVTLNADSIEFQQAFNVNGDLAMEASSITQEAALTVVGATRINNTATTTLTNSGNDFGTAVQLSNAGNVELTDRNSVEVRGNAVSLGVSTAAGATTLGELTTGTLRVNAEGIEQNARVVVNGESTLNANQLELNHTENDFVGKVTLNVDGKTELMDANSLRVAGSSNETHLQAQTLIVDGLSTQGAATLTADLIQQEGAFIANDVTNLKGGAVNLNAAPDNIFTGAVDLDLTGTANIRSSDTLVVGGNALAVNAHAASNLTVSALNAQDITLSAAQVNLQNFTAPGNLTLNGGTISQQGALTVEGTTTLGASTVLLGQQPNDFKGDVVLSNAGNVALQDANNVRVQGTADTLNMSAAGEVGQSGVLDIAETSNVTASRIILNNDANRFGGEVTVEATETATVHASNNLQLRGNANTLNVNSSGDVVFGATTAGTLAATATDEIRQVQSTAVVVDNTASFSAESLVLNNSANDFKNTVNLNVAGQASINDLNNLVIQGNAQTLTATAGGILTAGALEGVNIENGTLTAETIELNRLNISSAARLQANTITQTEASNTGGRLTLAATTVDLTRADNDFQGELILEGVQTATIQDANQLRIGGAAAALNASAVETLTFTDLAAGTLTATAQQINQTTEAGNEVRVTGTTNLSGENVDLRNSNNDFVGAVNLQVAEQAQLRDSNTLTLQGEVGQLNATAQQINQLANSTLTVANSTTINANMVNLNESGNDFQGDVVLNVSGNATVRDSNHIRVEGSVGVLNLSAANEVAQSGALNVASSSNIAAATINLNNNANRFDGEVAVEATETATVHASGNLQLRGNANTLNVNSTGDVVFGATTAGTLAARATDEIRQVQSTAVVVDNTASFSAESLVLNNSANDFKNTVNLNVAGQATVNDQNDLLIQGNAQTLAATARGTLTAGDNESFNINEGTLTATTIEVNKLNVLNAARLQADTITQTEASNTGGRLTLAATTVDLTQADNDFQGELILEGVQTATIQDANQLRIGGAATALNATAVETLTFTDLVAGTLTATAQQINQTTEAGNEVRVSGTTNLNAESVDLRNSNNDFVGAVNLQVTEQAHLRDSNTLTLEGQAGQLNATAQQINQLANSTLTVANNTALNASTVNLNESGNDFQGDVVLNVSGNATVRDANTLNVAGRVNGAATLVAESIEQANQQATAQANALRTDSTLLLQASNVNLSSNQNQFNGAVRIENAAQATLVSQGDLAVAGSNLENVNFTAEEVILNELGPLQQLTVAADEVKQNAALLVQGQTTLSANKVELNNSNNDFVGAVLVQSRSASTPTVQISDRNALAIQGNNMALAADVQGNLTVQANNVALGRSTVLGNTRIDLTGALSQTNSITLNGSRIKADRIVLNHSANRFNGVTELDSAQQIELRTAGNLTADTGSSTGALALNVGGNTNLQGEQITLAQSQFGGNLTVNANEISQSNGGGAIQVQGTTQLAAVGGEIDLQNAGNQFNGEVSANAEQTSIAANGDLRLLNLTSRGGEITADGRLLLLGNIEQTGGTLTFTARGIPRPLSSAELALMLPPSLDVFSNKEAVNPITGLGRLEVSSAVIDQQSGQISTAAGASTVFHSSQGGSINLTQVNQINGRLSALSGQAYGQAFAYSPNRGTSLFAVNNDVRLRVSEAGVEADLVAIRSRGLSTEGADAVIHARMPYNDLAVGTSRSFPGLTLSIPLNNAAGTQGGAAPFGESGNSGQSPGGGAIRVEVGDSSRAGLGGFLTVLPFEGSNLLPGQVVYLAGPERRGTQAFFYDGARSLDRIPVVYNGTLLLSPQENAALTTAQGAVVLARQEQTRSVVRTENVAGKVINGVVVEVGPGRPATEGEGGASKPASCDSAEGELSCNP